MTAPEQREALTAALRIVSAVMVKDAELFNHAVNSTTADATSITFALAGLAIELAAAPTMRPELVLAFCRQELAELAKEDA